MDKWKRCALDDVAEIKHGYAFKGEYFCDEPTDYLLLTPGNFAVGGGFQEKPKYYKGPIPENYVLAKNDLIVSMTDLSKQGDTLGYSALVPTSNRYLHNQRIGLVTMKNEKVLKSFAYWLMRTYDYQRFIVNHASGSTVKHTSPKTILSYEFDIPPIVEQRIIVNTLSALDGKIANSKAINHHLEQIAQMVFKSWFIDFEPWGGVMPEDWNIGSLIDIADYLNGLAMQRFRPADSKIGIPVLKIKELRQGSCDLSSELCSPNIRSEYIIHDGDVVFSWSGSLLVDFWCGGDCGLNQHLFKVTSTKYDKWFYYGWTRHHLDQFVAMAADKATTMGHIKREALENAEVLIPTTKDYAVIDDLMASLYEQLINNRVESRKLALFRDTLLPRLMSGELSVSDIDPDK